jgi:hypothetical protein
MSHNLSLARDRFRAGCTSAAALIAILATSACGGGNSPTSPSPVSTPAPAPAPAPAPVVTAVSIAPATDLVKIKGTESFTASATYSDGTSRQVQPTWQSDNTAVAAVEAGGRVTGIAPGHATIIARFEGHEATRLLRVVPDYEGQWNGLNRVTGCTDDGDWKRGGFCADLGIGDLFELTLGLAQNRDAVTGDADLGDWPGPVTGSIAVGGHLQLTGTLKTTIEGIPFEAVLSNWETLTLDNARMTGRFVITFKAAGIAGSARVEHEMHSMAKSGASLSRSPGRGAQPRIRQLLSSVSRPR